MELNPCMCPGAVGSGWKRLEAVGSGRKRLEAVGSGWKWSEASPKLAWMASNCCQALQAAQLAQRPDDTCLMTEHAVQRYLQHSMWLRVPSRLFAGRAGVPLEDLTQLEFAMTENEWELKPLQSSSDLARIPHKRGGRKLWFQMEHSFPHI